MWSKVNLVIGCLLTANYIASQPVNDGPENFRLPRELDFEKCCPCPETSGSSEGRNHGSPSLAPPESVDDCPCRTKSADSDGASSIFFPTYTKSIVRQNEEKEEAKNLLEPEVNLASSVLETLREVTEEEHQDALARDAARTKAAEENTFNDAIPEESGRNIVTIIVDPEQFEHDDAVTDSTHVQKSRISIPSSSSTNVIDDILKLPKKSTQDLLHRKLLNKDSYGGATNIRENFVNPVNESPQNSGDIDCDDLGFASSNMQERFAEKQNPKLKLKSINPINDLSEVKKMPLNNLFELKDAEFIPDKKYKDALKPNFEIKQLFNRDRQKPLDLFEILNGLKLNFKKPSLTNGEDNSIKTEILDTIPNNTNKMSKLTTNINSEVENIQINQTSGIPSDSQSNDVKTTDILDTLLKPPENQVVFIFDDETNLDETQERKNEKNERLKEESMAELKNIDESQKQAESLRENYEHLENDFDENLRTDNDDYYTDEKNEEFLRDEQNIADGFISINRKTDLDQSKESILSNTNIPLDCNQDTKTNNSENEFLLTEILNSETIPRKPSEIVNSLKENLKKRFEAIKQKSVLPKQDILKSKDSETSREKEDSNSNDKYSTLDNTETETRKGNAMSVTDLQILSDSLLKLNNKLEEQALTTERFQQSHQFIGKTDADIFESTTAKNTFDIDDIKDDLSSKEQKSNIEEYKNSCSSDLDFKQNEAANVENEPLVQSNPNEMEVGASEPISRTILGNPLSFFKSDHSIRNVVSEPMSLNDSPDENDNNMIGSLPTLKDITKQLSGIFKTVDENSNENSLAEAVCPSNDSEDEESLMSAEPSTMNQKSRLAPLQDINLELFQLKPSRREPDILKSFRTKLKLPKEFEIKPMKLNSVMDNKNSLLGGTLSVNPKYKSKSRLASKPLDDFSNVLKRPFGELPRLDDITTSFRENAQNLLNRGRNLIPNDLAPTSSLDTLTENLKSRTENAVQNIKQSVDSTFKDVNGNTLFGDRIPKPNELFEKIASIREDFNEKLLGLHHDLNDRLTTLHENIFDQTRFMSSRIPIIKPGEKGRTNIQPIKKNKPKPLKHLTAESRTEEVQKYIPLRNRIESNDFRNSDRIFEPESNVPVLKSVEMPRLEQTIRNPPLGLPRRDYNLMSNNLESTSNIEKPSFHPGKSLLRKEINPFKDSTFKITFATTTPTPTTPMPKSKLFITPKERNDFITNWGTSRMPKLKSHDNNVLPSDIQPARLPVPNKQTIYADDESITPQSSRAKHLPMRIIQPLTRSENIDEADESNEQHEGLLRKPWSGVIWPKKSDESLLTQIRDEIKTRKAMESIDRNNKQPSNDIIKSTSDNTEVQVFDKHLKENVTYKCKMICTRE